MEKFDIPTMEYSPTTPEHRAQRMMHIIRTRGGVPTLADVTHMFGEQGNEHAARMVKALIDTECEPALRSARHAVIMWLCGAQLPTYGAEQQ